MKRGRGFVLVEDHFYSTCISVALLRQLHHRVYMGIIKTGKYEWQICSVPTRKKTPYACDFTYRFTDFQSYLSNVVLDCCKVLTKFRRLAFLLLMNTQCLLPASFPAKYRNNSSWYAFTVFVVPALGVLSWWWITSNREKWNTYFMSGCLMSISA